MSTPRSSFWRAYAQLLAVIGLGWNWMLLPASDPQEDTSHGDAQSQPGSGWLAVGLSGIILVCSSLPYLSRFVGESNPDSRVTDGTTPPPLPAPPPPAPSINDWITQYLRAPNAAERNTIKQKLLAYPREQLLGPALSRTSSAFLVDVQKLVVLLNELEEKQPPAAPENAWTKQKQATDLLAKLAGDKTPSAKAVLATIGKPVLFSYLFEEQDVHWNAKAALQHLDPKWETQPDALKRLPSMIDALIGPNADRRRWMLRLLNQKFPGWEKNPRAQAIVPDLVHLFVEDCRAKEQQRLNDGKAVLRILDQIDPNWPANTNNPRLVEAMRENLDRGELIAPSVKILRAMGPKAKSACPTLIQRLEKQDIFESLNIRTALESIDADGWPKLPEARLLSKPLLPLLEKERDRRELAMNLMCRIQDRSVIPELIVLMVSDDPKIASSAREVLTAMDDVFPWRETDEAKVGVTMLAPLLKFTGADGPEMERVRRVLGILRELDEAALSAVPQLAKLLTSELAKLLTTESPTTKEVKLVQEVYDTLNKVAGDTWHQREREHLEEEVQTFIEGLGSDKVSYIAKEVLTKMGPSILDSLVRQIVSPLASEKNQDAAGNFFVAKNWRETAGFEAIKPRLLQIVLNHLPKEKKSDKWQLSLLFRDLLTESALFQALEEADGPTIGAIEKHLDRVSGKAAWPKRDGIKKREKLLTLRLAEDDPEVVGALLRILDRVDKNWASSETAKNNLLQTIINNAVRASAVREANKIAVAGMGAVAVNLLEERLKKKLEKREQVRGKNQRLPDPEALVMVQLIERFGGKADNVFPLLKQWLDTTQLGEALNDALQQTMRAIRPGWKN